MSLPEIRARFAINVVENESHELLLIKRYPEAKIFVFYIDLRTPGKYEKFRENLMADENAEFIKGKVA